MPPRGCQKGVFYSNDKMTCRRILLLLLTVLLSVQGLSAQQKKGEYSLKVKLTDSVSHEPVSYATIYVSKDGSTERAYYAMTDGEGAGVISGIPAGRYVFVAELMGYYTLSRKVELKEAVLDLGELLMNQDVTMLNQSGCGQEGYSGIYRDPLQDH